MRILIRFSLKSVLATFLTALLIFSFLVMAVETFMHLDSFMTLGTFKLRYGKLTGFALSLIIAVAYWYMMFFSQRQ